MWKIIGKIPKIFTYQRIMMLFSRVINKISGTRAISPCPGNERYPLLFKYIKFIQQDFSKLAARSSEIELNELGIFSEQDICDG